MKKLLYGLFTLAILIASAFAVAAGPGPGGHGGPGGPGPERLLDSLLSLKLTDAQKHDVAVILKKSRDAFETGAKAMGDAIHAMHEVMRAEPGNEEHIRAASRTVAKAAEDMAVRWGRLEADLLKVLTPEQRKLWVERMTPPAPSAKGRRHVGHELFNDWVDAHAGKTN